MSVTTIFDHDLNSGSSGIGADAYPLGDGTPAWNPAMNARASVGVLTAAMCTLSATDWSFTPPTAAFPVNYCTVTPANTSATYPRLEHLVYFVWDTTKCHKFNQVPWMRDGNGNQFGTSIRVSGANLTLMSYRNFTNNSWLQLTSSSSVAHPTNGDSCLLRTISYIDAANDIVWTTELYNLTTSPGTPIKSVSQTVNGTESWSNYQQGVSMGDNTNEALTSPLITRMVINGLTSQVSLQSGGSTVNVHSVSGQRYIPVYPDTFPGSPVALDIYQGSPGTLPTGVSVNNGLSNLTPNTDEPGWIVLDCASVTPNTYGLTVRGQNGGQTGTVAVSLVAGDVLSRTADTKRGVQHGSSSMASAYANVETEANIIYETAPNAWAYTQYLDAFATLCVVNDWLLVPDGGEAKANSGLNLGISNKAHYLAGGAAYYNCFDSGDLPGSMADVLAAYDDLWGQYVKNGIHVIFVAHQSPANNTNICSGSLVAFTPGATTDTLELESGDAALCEAGDGIYITSTDTNSLQFASILSVSGDSVITEKFLRTDDLPDAGRAYWVGDKAKYQWFEDMRTELGKRGTEGEAEFIEDATTGARVWFVTRDQLYGGYELHDWWRMYGATDRFHVQAAGNPGYGGVIARAIAWVDLQRGSPALTPNPMGLTAGGATGTTTKTDSVDSDAAIPGTLASGSYESSNPSVATVNSSSGVVTPVAAGTANIIFNYLYNATKDPTLVVNVAASGGGRTSQDQRWPFGFIPRF